MADVFNRAPKGKYSETWDVGDPALIPKVNYPATTPEELGKNKFAFIFLLINL